MYKPNSLDEERSSWRTVIFFNVLRSIKHILATLEAWDDTWDEQAGGSSRGTHIDSGNQSDRILNSAAVPNKASPTKESLKYQIANLRLRLSPLVAADPQLADRLTGGVTVSGSGKGGVFVRSGWQARSGGGGQPRKHGASRGDDTNQRVDSLVEDVCKMLTASKTNIRELWEHPTVRKLISNRKLLLEEWSEL